MRFPRARDLGPLLVVWALSMAVIVFQRDLGTALLYFGLFLVMLYVATSRLSWVLLGLGLFFGGAFVGEPDARLRRQPLRRLARPVQPRASTTQEFGGSYQLVQGLFGLANGGLIGTGLGPAAAPTSRRCRRATTSSRASARSSASPACSRSSPCTCCSSSRGFRIGFAGQDDFGKLLGVGLAFVVALQVFIVVGGVTRVIPLTGLTTPFLAAGGSSLVANWIIVALLLRLSDTVRNHPRLVIDG